MSVKLSKKVIKITAGIAETIFANTLDTVLWNIAFIGELSLPGPTYGKIWRAESAAFDFVGLTNYQTIKNAINNAKRNGYIIKTHRHVWPQITQAGKERLNSLLPFYDEKRFWDGRMYLVTYDIPEKHHYDRDTLRGYLKLLGGGKLQDSVWITPYDPADNIKRFIDEHHLRGTVIISSVGKDGSVGDEDIKSLVVRVYKLSDLSEKYSRWLENYVNQDSLTVLSFLTILKDDPQLPFQLLPKWWMGDKAYQIIKPQLQKLYINLRP